ncbi:MAG: hypothetical protein R3Y08_03795 [Rikenellaceae bacterium]
MKKIQIILSLFLLVAACQVAQAQKMKLVERSAKTAPNWINNLERGYIIASSAESDLEVAKQSVLMEVKREIAQSIVSNVSVEYFSASVTTETQQEMAYASETIDVVRSTTDKIPFLQSISLSKIADFYWEKYYEKKSGATEFKYYIKYPFSSQELDDLVDEFNANQARINRTIEQMKQELESYTQIEDIAKNMGTLRALVPEFAAGDYRIKVVDELLNSYRDQYKYISVEEVENEDHRVVLQPFVNGRAVTTSQIPLHKSNCADRITKNVSQGVIVVTYDDYVCRAGEDNWIDLTFKFGTYFVVAKIHIIK